MKDALFYKASFHYPCAYINRVHSHKLNVRLVWVHFAYLSTCDKCATRPHLWAHCTYTLRIQHTRIYSYKHSLFTQVECATCVNALCLRMRVCWIYGNTRHTRIYISTVHSHRQSDRLSINPHAALAQLNKYTKAKWCTCNDLSYVRSTM